MNIRRKGLSVAFTATLLSSLLATVAATAVSGAVTIPTGVGNVPRGGTSANTLVINFTENSAACIPAGGGTVTYTINDANGGDVTFSGTPTLVGPGSLGTTASVAGNVLTLTFAGSDVANVEQVTVSGLAISAAATAAPGPIVAALGGTVGGCFTGAAAAAGLLSSAAGIGATTVIVAVSNLACPFVVTGTPLVGVSPAVTAGSLVLGSETRTITAASAVAPDGTQTLTLGAALGVAHPANDPATQSGACLGAPSPGTVANALTQTVSTPTQVFPGENNQPVANVILSEAPSGTATTFANAQVVTFTITNPAAGVVFSAAPTLTGPGPNATCALSFDRRSCTATIAGATAGNDVYTLTNVRVDVDPTVPLGTPVRILASIPGIAINATATNQIVAFVGRVIVGVAAQPTILIGVNDQQSGMITLTESGSGFFRAGVGSNNTFGLCLTTGETFTRAPWAVVTNAGGTGASGLQLLSGLVGASQVQGTLFNDGRCAYWTIFTSSTTGGGVIEIRGSADGATPLPSGANNGPRLSVPAGLAPGSTQVQIRVGQQADVINPASTAAVTSLVSNAVRAFRSGPIVAATSQPVCPRGSTDCLAGNITITEQFNGQLKAGQVITLRILPRATVQRQDVILKTGVTNDLPIVTTNSASGLLVSPVSVTCPPSALLGITLCTATFVVTQQSFGPTLGQITVSNIHYVVAADAVEGPVLVNVSAPGAGAGGPANAASIDAVVSNARIGTAGTGAGTRTSILNGTLPGVVKVSEGRTFTATTKVVRRGQYVTWQADMDPAMAGERVEVWIARKSNAAGATYGAFTRFTTRAVNSQGLAVFHYDNADQPGWVSVRFRFAGNTQHAAATSLARQARYL